jgi:acetyltransferase-like isoleucine patch superfamily enzyme
MRIILKFILAFRRIRRRAKMILYRPLFCSHGKNFVFDPDAHYTFNTISVGNNVFIGPRAYLNSTHSTIDLGDGVMIGPEVMMVGGNHRYSVLGVPMHLIHEKTDGDDGPITIGSDVWIGARATILKDVTVGEGAIVAAGAVVTRDVPPYSIVAGVPARVVKMRFSEEDLKRHLELLKVV